MAVLKALCSVIYIDITSISVKKNQEQNKSWRDGRIKKTNPRLFVEHNELGQQTNLPFENKKSAVVVVRW